MKKFFIVGQSRISVDSINSLALFSTTLDPNKDEVRESFGYASALEEYYKKNDTNLKKCYIQLTKDEAGKQFLYSSIELTLLEKKMRENGISRKLVEVYEKLRVNYQNQLESNMRKQQTR